jgi:hypothetical protein
MLQNLTPAIPARPRRTVKKVVISYAPRETSVTIQRLWSESPRLYYPSLPSLKRLFRFAGLAQWPWNTTIEGQNYDIILCNPNGGE